MQISKKIFVFFSFFKATFCIVCFVRGDLHKKADYCKCHGHGKVGGGGGGEGGTMETVKQRACHIPAFPLRLNVLKKNRVKTNQNRVLTHTMHFVKTN